MHFLKEDCHDGISIFNTRLIFEVSKTEYSGRFAGVGYEEVGIGFILQLPCTNDFISFANSYQLVMPAFE